MIILVPTYSNLPWGQSDINSIGDRIVLASYNDYLVESDTNGVSDIFVVDVVGLDVSTRRISMSPTGQEANGGSYHPSISGDGRYVAFESDATNLVTGYDLPSGVRQVYLYDITDDQMYLVSKTNSGVPGNYTSVSPAVSSVGPHVVYRNISSKYGSIIWY